MALSTQPYKGSRDFYPADKRVQNWIFEKWRKTCESFGFLEYDGPLLEPFEMYAAKTGEEIVNTQLYSFVDRGDRRVAIRPEMTPTLARMVAGKIQEIPKPVRWFSIPNLWRYERPQKGRLREHWQLNVDILGGDSLLADAECIRVALKLFDNIGASSKVSIRVNNRRLMDQLFVEKMKLTPDQATQVAKALDSRAKITPEAFDSWLDKAGCNVSQKGTLNEFLNSSLKDLEKSLSGKGLEELSQLLEMLGNSGSVLFDPTIMRGMDYYTSNVFEAYDVSPDNRRALFGGGRYDNLVGLFTKNSLSGVGFGLGDVTFQDFLTTHALMPSFESNVDVFVTLPSNQLIGVSESLASQLRDAGLTVMTPLGVDGFGAQLKMASKHKCRFVVILGADELARGNVQLKNMLTGDQVEISKSELVNKIKL